MSDQVNSTDERTSTRTTSVVDRRNVLKGIGAVGLGSAFVGLGQAKPDHANGGQGASEVPIGSQLFTYGFGTYSVSELIHHHAEAGYDVFEPFTLDDEDAIAAAMEETGVEMSSAHASLDDALNSPDEMAETYSQFGNPALIQASTPEDIWTDEDAIIEYAETINEAADNMAERGFEFGVHNHEHEFVEVDGRDELGYEIFAQEVNDNVHLQVDVAWAWAGGANPVELINRYSNNVESLHMKDAVMTDDGAELVEIGEGDVPLEALANVARTAADVDYLLYEYDLAPNPIESLYNGAEYLEIWNGPSDRGRNRN